ncbi:hypothetical protein THIOM_005316 [Candidatus Thiomargarita nelsonii]|uniref:Uncharacterized protein n=1 Tax=Candidatus Thiomargarita nelsonii TaxID=1003181 RepID=A0A176RTK7_9GAMM|nr:hypothetical protein THIOM_005316 [Candidatus Thiomargarita nelsonii]
MSKLIEELKVYGELLPHSDFKVVTLHPLADEVEILNRLDMLPNECTSCDLYWVFKEEMFFVSIMSKENPLVTYYSKPNVKHGHSFYIVTHTSPLYTGTIKTALKYLSRWIINNNKRLEKKRHRAEGFKMTNMDICNEKYLTEETKMELSEVKSKLIEIEESLPLSPFSIFHSFSRNGRTLGLPCD